MAKFHENLRYHEDKTEKRELNNNDIEFLKALQKERNTQDNCCTADVRTWVIKDRKDLQANEDSYDYTVLYDPNRCQALSTEDIYNELVEYMEQINDIEVCDVVYNPKEDRLIFEYDGYRGATVYGTKDGEDSIYVDDNALEFIQEYLYGEDVQICYMQKNWVHEFCFLTQKAAENYLKRKGHNHHSDAHTYCICTYCDPEIAKLMEILERVDWDKVGATNE